MDYNSIPTDSDSRKNDKFTQTLFTKWQWDAMLQNIKFKLYSATRLADHTLGFNAYLNGSY